MNKKIAMTILFVTLFSAIIYAFADTEPLFNKIKITDSDIPAGFMYGKIPGFAQNILKNNPWVFDKNAVNKLARNIYPGSNSSYIKSIHMTILTRSDQPYGDDIVCYMIIFRDNVKAKKEISKIKDYVKYNSDRAILKYKENIAILIHADDASDYNLISKISKTIDERLNSVSNFAEKKL